jgi:hypothetical protein
MVSSAAEYTKSDKPDLPDAIAVIPARNLIPEFVMSYREQRPLQRVLSVSLREEALVTELSQTVVW